METSQTPAERLAAGFAGVVRNAAMAVVALALLAVVLLGAVLVPLLGLGVPLLLEVAPLVRRCADAQRRWVGGVLGVSVADPHAPPVPGPWGTRFRALVRDRATRRDVGWLCWQALGGPVCALPVVLVVAVAVGLAVVAAGGWTPVLVLAGPAVVVLLVAVLLAPPLTRLQAVVSRWLLAGPEQRTASSARIAELTRTRARSVDAAAAELRRIERDLHDGVQARLVALGLAVGVARTTLRTAPEQAGDLLDDVSRDVRATLEELRALIRGIHPPVLAERGLAAAVEALALAAPLEVHTRVELDERFAAPVESAVYFTAAELLTNLRHAAAAGATAATLDLRHDGERMHLTVRDDGRGGAEPGAARSGGGSGLDGVRDRLAAFDGRITVSSPVGGPTELHVEVPCAPSSPRTRPCSATASAGSSPPTTSP